MCLYDHVVILALATSLVIEYESVHSIAGKRKSRPYLGCVTGSNIDEQSNAT